jgi:hypothetical protein
MLVFSGGLRAFALLLFCTAGWAGQASGQVTGQNSVGTVGQIWIGADTPDLNDEVLSDDVAQLTHSLEERIELSVRRVWSEGTRHNAPRVQESDPIHFLRRLCTGGER